MAAHLPNEARAELGSALASLAALTARIEDQAQSLQRAEGGSKTAADLFAVEAVLRTAHRRLDKVLTGIR